MEDEYISAQEAADLLGVSLPTIYAYVSRKRVRSQQLPGSKSHRYWRPDIERLRKRERRPPAVAGELRQESEITLLTERGPYYRGRSAIELAETASLESVAALLWNVDERDVFTPDLPRGPKNFGELAAATADESGADRVLAFIPFLERANPRSLDLSARGMARTGADVIRWLAAIMLRQPRPSPELIHLQFGRALHLTPDATELARRVLILSVDHGFEEAAFAVRAVASTGVTPWRAVATGLAVTTGRRSKFGQTDALRRFLADIVDAEDPEEPVVRRIRDGEALPGFASAVYARGDPRARALLDFCARAFASDQAYGRLERALEVVRELQGLEPNFPLAVAFSAQKVGAGDRTGPASYDPLFLIGRAVGWIAHSIEQYQTGEAVHREVIYRGPMPAAQR
jgi:citrate synthase